MSFNLGSAHGDIVIDYNGAGVQQAIGDLGALQQQGTNLMKAGGILGAGGAALGAGLASVIGTSADFEQALDKTAVSFGLVQGASEATDAAYNALGQTIQDVASTTVFGSQEVAEAAQILGKSGATIEDIQGGLLQATTDFAAATDTSLPQAANILSRTAAQWGVSGTDMIGVADDLTTVMNSTSLGSDDLLGGLANLAPMMKLLGADLADTGATMGFFKDQGLSAREVGTSLTAAMGAMIAPTDKQAEAMAAAGIATEDFFRIGADGQREFIGWADTLDLLNTKLADYDDISKAAFLQQFFGKEAFDALGLGILSDTDKLRDLTDEMNNNEGVARAQSEALTDNLRGALENLGGTFEKLQIAMGNPFLGPLQSIVEGLAGFLNALSGLDPALLSIVGKIAAVAAGFLLLSGGVLTAVGAVLRFGPAIATAFAAAVPFLAILLAIGAAIGLGILAYKTDFLGFGTAVDKAMSRARLAIDKFGKGFNAALFRGQVAGFNGVANAVQAFGDALLYATGIDITGFTDRMAASVQAFGDTWEAATTAGFNPAAIALLAVSAALGSLGLEGAAAAAGNLGNALQDFGKIFEEAFGTGQEQRLSGLAAAIDAFGVALQLVTGLPVADFFDKVASALDVFTAGFNNAVGAGLNPFEAALLGVRDALSFLTGIDLAPIFDQLGASIQSAIEGIQTFIQTLQAGDIAGALAQIQTAVGDALGDLVARLSQIGSDIATILSGLVVNLTDWVLNVAAPTLQGWITTASAWLGEHIRAAVSAASGALAELSNWVLTVAAPTLAGWVNAAAGWLSSTITGVVNALSGIEVAFSNWTLTIDAPDAGGITIDGSGVASAIGDALNGVLSSIDFGEILDVATFSSRVGAAFRAVYEAALDAIVAAITVLTSADVIEATNNALLGIGAAITAAVVGFAAGFVLGGEVDFSALANSLRDKLTTALNSVFGETAQAGLGGTGVTNTLVQNLSDQIFEMFNTAATDIAARVGTIDWTAIPKAVAQGIGDALANFGTALFGANEVQAAEGGDTFDAAAFGTQFGDQLAASFESPEFIDAVTASVEAMPAETFSAIGTGMLTKISESITAAMGAGQPGIGEGVGDSSTIGAGLGTSLVTAITTGLQTAIDSAPIETFAAIGTSLITKIQGAISAAMTTADTGGQQGPVGEGAAGGMGASLVSGLATSIAASITAAPIEAFAAIGTALQTKISEVLATAMQAGGGQATPQAGLGGTGGGGGIGQAIAQSIADAISGADFAAVASALQTNLGTAVTTAIQEISTTISTATNVWISTFITTFTAIAQAALAGMAGVVTAVQAGLQAISERISSYTNVWITTITTTVAAMQASLNGFAASAAAAGTAAGTGFSTGLGQGMSTAQSTVVGVVAAIIGIMNAAVGEATAAGVAVGTGFANGISSTTGLAEAAGRAVAAAAIGSMNATIKSASPSKVTMGIGEMFGQGFALGIAGTSANAATASHDLGLESIHALAESLRSKAEAKAASLRGLGDHIRENQGIATGGGQPMTIETTGTVEMDGQAMGTFVVETSMGGLAGAMRKGGRRRGRMQ